MENPQNMFKTLNGLCVFFFSFFFGFEECFCWLCMIFFIFSFIHWIDIGCIVVPNSKRICQFIFISVEKHFFSLTTINSILFLDFIYFSFFHSLSSVEMNALHYRFHSTYFLYMYIFISFNRRLKLLMVSWFTGGNDTSFGVFLSIHIHTLQCIFVCGAPPLFPSHHFPFYH